MADDENETDGIETIVEAGGLLLWRIPASEIAAYGARVERFYLGTWAAAPIGLGAEAYFDVEVGKPVPLSALMLIFGRPPDRIY